MRGLMEWLAARPRASASVACLLTLLALPLLPRLSVDNSLEVWLPGGGSERREYERFREIFGSEEYVLVVYRLSEPLADDLLERLVDLRFELEAVPGVKGVYDLSSIYGRFYTLAGRGRFEEDLGSPFFRGFLVSEDRSLGATWVLLSASSVSGRREVVEAIRAATRTAGLAEAGSGEEVWLAGSPVLNVALDEASTSAARRFYPLVFVISAAILLLVFRRGAGIAIPALSVGCGLVWTLGLLALTGRSLNMVTVALPPVVWVVGLATSIHLLSRCQSRLRRGDEPGETVVATMTELARPCLMSAVTSSLGFLALTASSMRPVREMGLFAAAGVLCCLASNFLLFPWLGRWWGVHRGRWRERSAVAERMTRLGKWVLAHSSGVLAVSLSLTVAALGGVLRLRADSNVIEFFDDETEIARTYEVVLPSLTGPYSLEVLLDGGARPRSLATLGVIDSLARRIEQWDGVARVLSVADFVKKASMPIEDRMAPYELPRDEESLATAWERVDESLTEEVGALSAADGTLRLSVIARPMGSVEHRLLVDELDRLLSRPELAEFRPRLTGVVRLLVELQDELLRSQVRTFALAFLVIVPVIGLFFRSLRYALLSLPPNLVPILMTLGLMGLLDVALDPATVMIAAIAFGIAVDDSIHFLSHYRDERRAGREVRESLLATLAAVGRPLWITSVVVAAGFSVLCFSSFVPLFDFGLLSAVTILAALVGNVVLLPAVLARTARSSDSGAGSLGTGGRGARGLEKGPETPRPRG